MWVVRSNSDHAQPEIKQLYDKPILAEIPRLQFEFHY
jgi:hypothetical protein